jgi:hypothetical protein
MNLDKDTKPDMHKLNKQQTWYLITVCGFTAGLVLGAWFISHNNPLVSGKAGFLELFFWVFPTAGAGVGMGLGQWSLIRHSHKNAYLWIFATTIGIILITGGSLLVFAIINYSQLGNTSWLFSQLPRWFTPLTIISPIIIFTGPFFQWLVMRHVTRNKSIMGFLKLSLGWVLAIITLFIMLGISGTAAQGQNGIFNLLGGIAATVPTGLIFAYSTINILRDPLSEKRVYD